jgi:outer membrane receptor protein involved in Fe transport
MLTLRTVATGRSLLFFNTLLMATAFTVPAFAQIETVVVTAEKRAEDIQTVPIAVTAISGADLKQKQIYTFKDLQFNVPNVTFAKTGLGSGIITIRGIGQAAGDPGVAQYHDGVFSESADLATGNYFDLESIQVLRGPQGTLYGRGSVGGTVNLISNKPDLDNFLAQGEAGYGEYNDVRADAVLNVPIIDGELAARVAGQFTSHDGYIKNISPGQQDQNGQNDYSVRGSVRWQPNPGTTIDVNGTYYNEADTRTRGDNTECQRDPTGVLGCLPTGLGFQPSNGYANSLGILTSAQVMGGFGALVGEGTAAGLGGFNSATAGVLCGLGPTGACGLPGVGFGDISAPALGAALAANAGPPSAVAFGTIFNTITAGYATAAARASLTNLQVANGVGSQASIANQIPQDIGVVNTPLTPKFDETSVFLTAHWNQKVADWLTFDMIGGYDTQNRHTTNSYNNLPGEDLSPSLNNAVPALEQFALLAGNSPAKVANLAAEYYSHVVGGKQQIPLSNPIPGGIANITTGIQNFSSYSEASDLEVNRSREESLEARFTTNFQGPLNFTFGAFYWTRNTDTASYRVTFSGGDYFSTFAGLAFAGTAPGSQPYIGVDPMYYQDAPSRSKSTAAFADGTYTIIPDLLTFRAGLRWSEDKDVLNGDHTSFTGLQSPTPAACAATGFCFLPVSTNAAATIAAASGYLFATGTHTTSDTSLVNYRGVLEYTPKLDFTDQTMFYLSYSKGSKPGNVNLIPAAVATALPATFKPEELTSTEIGTKNTLLDGTLQANLDAWYYQYQNFQYTVIAYSTLFTQNFGANMWGEEAEIIWQPDDHWMFNLNATNSDSSIGNFYAVDARNPTAGRTNTVLIKDIALNGSGDLPGNNCVVVTNTGMSPADDPAVAAAFASHHQQDPFFAPAQGSAALRGAPNTLGNVQFSNFGNCTTNWQALGLGNAYHYAGPGDGAGSNTTGIAVPLKGKQMLNLPPNTIAVGAQYTFDFDGYTLVPRADYYWQNGYFSRVFNDPIDSVGSWDQLNLSVQLNAPDAKWYLKGYVTNVSDKRNIQALGPAADTSGLYTTVYLEDPRVIGFMFGTHW